LPNGLGSQGSWRRALRDKEECKKQNACNFVRKQRKQRRKQHSLKRLKRSCSASETKRIKPRESRRPPEGQKNDTVQHFRISYDF